MKEELTGEKEILIGTWRLVHTDHYFGWCDGDNWFEQLTPATESKSFIIQLHRQGILSCFKNGDLIGQYRMVFDYFVPETGGHVIYSDYGFNIYFGNSNQLNFSGGLNADTLVSTSLANFFFRTESGCENYLNYFVKE